MKLPRRYRYLVILVLVTLAISQLFSSHVTSERAANLLRSSRLISHDRNTSASIHQDFERALSKLSPQQRTYLLQVARGDTALQQENKTTEFEAKIKAEALSTVDSSIAGTIFHGEVIREFDKSKRIFFDRSEAESPRWMEKREYTSAPSSLPCTKWSVVTTIMEPSEAVQRVATLSEDWCLVIVADTNTPKDFMQQAGWSNSHSNGTFDDRHQQIHFLSTEQQEEWAHKMGGRVSAFIDSIPFHHFARKNIGYLYAIHHNAQLIFDFDDYNILDENLTSPIGDFGNENRLENTRMAITTKAPFNHHPLMQASESTQSENQSASSWSRGFPFDSILDKYTQGVVGVVDRPYRNSSTIPLSKIAVMQYCADGNPDIDAVHRLMKPLPVVFERGATATPLLVPSRVYSPYNSQATIHTQPALFALLLPFTVSSRVSDIWRGYFAQRLFHDLDLRLAFLPPRVRQARNDDSYISDLQAERALYLQAGRLLEFLDAWSSEDDAHTSVPQKMESLWIALYERGYIEENDVLLVQLWLQALIELGYQFPSFTNPRIQNVAIMGQFNYANSVRDTSFWAMKWRQKFRHVQVRGHWSETEAKELWSAGVETYTNIERGDGKAGFTTPYQNLGFALQQFKNVPDVDGVVYIHDDAFLNISFFSDENQMFQVDRIIANSVQKFPYAFLDPDTFTKQFHSVAGFKVDMNGTFHFFDGFQTPDVRVALGYQEPYYKKWECLNRIALANKDPLSERFRGDNGTSLILPSNSQADFLFVPTKYADDYYQAAELMIKYDVFLECAVPTIVQMVHQVSGGRSKLVPLCTAWGAARRHPKMLDVCLLTRNTGGSGIIHPLKVGEVGVDTWNDVFDSVPSYKYRGIA